MPLEARLNAKAPTTILKRMDRPRAHPEPRRRTGGRSARVVRDVLSATLDELAKGGYVSLSFEAVAARAGVSRTTVYRRWPTKPDLVRAALLAMADEQPAPADTGEVRADLVETLASRVCAFSARHTGISRVALSEHTDPEVTLLARFVRERFHQPFVAAVERGVARGQLPRGTDPRLLVELITAPLHLRICMFDEAIPRADVERIVDLVLAGARASAAARSSRS